MSKLHVIETAQDLDRKSVIETLEAALAEAREGLIRGVALAVVRPDLALNTSWSDSNAAAPLVGAVAVLQKRIVESLDG
ncbi:hypothetical protein [Tardiphaga sp.]|uniref:hypothetical protein n=1 Tax=Tardiphaga sp. TaxID=1926292 RepID=UPI0026020F61|nr:hypothetical protein [Tardiphaga sp.]MDB5620519.1 hypothetical protein [Tardiphaga sp.]